MSEEKKSWGYAGKPLEPTDQMGHGAVVRRTDLIGKVAGTVAPYNPSDPVSVMKRAGMFYIKRHKWIRWAIAAYSGKPDNIPPAVTAKLKRIMSELDKEDQCIPKANPAETTTQVITPAHLNRPAKVRGQR